MRTPSPIIEFLRCIVGSKVSALEKGLKENLDLRLPRVSPDVLKLSAVNITELAGPIGVAEGYHACAGCGGRGQREACVKDVNIDPIVVLPHK